MSIYYQRANFIRFDHYICAHCGKELKTVKSTVTKNAKDVSKYFAKEYFYRDNYVEGQSYNIVNLYRDVYHDGCCCKDCAKQGKGKYLAPNAIDGGLGKFLLILSWVLFGCSAALLLLATLANLPNFRADSLIYAVPTLIFLALAIFLVSFRKSREKKLDKINFDYHNGSSTNNNVPPTNNVPPVTNTNKNTLGGTSPSTPNAPRNSLGNSLGGSSSSNSKPTGNKNKLG